MIGPSNDGGDRLTDFLDASHVETRWIAGWRIVWQTGQINGPLASDPDRNTHCSAYVAAMALVLDFYILRPRHHGTLNLANAQVTWLGGGDGGGDEKEPTAAASGWSALGSSGDDGVLDAACTAANLGKMVVAGYFQPPSPESDAGHIVIVRPQASFAAEDGPQVVTAGVKNFRTASMRAAFSDHPDAWPDAIQLFVHTTPLE